MYMAKRLTRRNPGAAEMDLFLDSTAFIGRFDPVQKKRKRDFRGAGVAIAIPSDYVSRAHAMIYDDGTIKDLNSTQGTKVNDKKIEPNTKVRLHEGDKIQIATVKFEYTERAAPTRYGLIVCQYGLRERRSLEHIRRMSHELSRAGFSIESVVERTDTKEDVLEIMERFKRIATEGSVRFVYLPGHHTRRGDIKLHPWRSAYGKITPAELREALNDHRGEKLLVMDGTYGGYKAPPRTTIIGSSTDALHGLAASATMGAIAGSSIGYCSRALTEIVAPMERFDLDETIEKATAAPGITVSANRDYSGDEATVFTITP
jgi:hypothetical protein